MYSDDKGLWTISSAISIVSQVRKSRSTSHRETPCSWRFLKLVLCEGVPLHQKQSGAHSAQVVEAQDEEDEGEHVLEENEASDDELEVEYQEIVTMMTIPKQRRAEVDRARQFFRKPQSSEDRKVQLDKLEQKFPCARFNHELLEQYSRCRGASPR